MKMPSGPGTWAIGGRRRGGVAALIVVIVGSAAGISAHVVRGLLFGTQAMAFVSSPAAGADAPIPIAWGAQDTGLRVVCFNVANSSPALAGASDWPRVIGAGFELPGAPRGFRLIAPADGTWELIEGAALPVPGHAVVGVDFAILARPERLRGLPPGQPAVRGSGTRFCVSGPFPATVNGAATTIETLINGVIVGFVAGETADAATDLGVWTDPLRTIPLYP
jgi:hypothetical protein